MKKTKALKWESYLAVAVRAAKAAGEIQRKHYGRVKSIKFKGEINLVTEVDKACEAKIQKILKSKFPDHDFLMEESGAAKKKSDFQWIVDPLDGTTNYAHAYPVFCSSIALAYRGKPVVGVVYDPMRNELFSGVAGKGAWLNGKRVRVSPIKDLNRALLATGFAYNVRETKNNNLDHFRDFLMTAQAVRRDGAAALDICYVACGRFEGFWELGLWPWDIAAAMVVLQEAGGQVSRFHGKPIGLHDKEILVSNSHLHKNMIKILNG